MKRLFIAIEIRPEKDLLDAFEKVRHTLRMERINRVRPEIMHPTLGRIRLIRHQNHLAQLMLEYREVVFQTSLIREVLLYESILKPEGPDYIPLTRFPL